jgi:hypothetical protein
MRAKLDEGVGPKVRQFPDAIAEADYSPGLLDRVSDMLELTPHG